MTFLWTTSTCLISCLCHRIWHFFFLSHSLSASLVSILIMRFLLHASKGARSNGIKSSASKVEVALDPPKEIAQKAWGQQCSPNCGCVVRFESTIDSDDIIVSASYQAKTVLTSLKDGRLEPHYTSNNKIMLRKCQCETLHHLATSVTEHLQGRRVDQIRNMLGVHSSPAVIHTCLKAQQLNTRHTHCFQVVEQAVVGLVCGYLPSLHLSELRYDDDNISVDIMAEKKVEPETKDIQTLTWESYVDELYHQYDENDVERSAWPWESIKMSMRNCESQISI